MRLSRCVYIILILAISVNALGLSPRQSKPKPQKKTEARKVVKHEKLEKLVGILLELPPAPGESEGKVVREEGSQYSFIPASTIKVATAYAALIHYGTKEFDYKGPDYQFRTKALITGTIDKLTETLHGDVYIEGEDPSMQAIEVEQIKAQLFSSHIKKVDGNLYVSKYFSMLSDVFPKNHANPDVTRTQSVMHFYLRDKDAREGLLSILSPWANVSTNPRKQKWERTGITFKSVKLEEQPPSSAEMITTITSEPLYRILKVMLCFSINPMAEQIGTTLGGPHQLEDFLRDRFKFQKDELHISSTSGLNQKHNENHITTHAMMQILLAFNREIEQHNIKLSQVLAVAGIDHGTLNERFCDADRGTVIAKTGSLPYTDSGVSALVGATQTNQGLLWFVMFGQHGKMAGFHGDQKTMIDSLQHDYGGGLPFGYKPTALLFDYHPLKPGGRKNKQAVLEPVDTELEPTGKTCPKGQ